MSLWKRGKFLIILMATLFMLSAMTPNAHAAVPMTMNYQGYLTDSEGTPVNGTVDMTFSLYATSGGASALWWEDHSVTVTDGVYSVVLGNTTPLSPSHFIDPLYLGVQVGTDAEMTPRQKITSVAFAINADRLDGQDASDFLTTETDPTVPSSVKDGITWTEVSSRPSGLDDGDDVGITSESDPTVPSSVKDGITWTEVSSRPSGLDDGDDVGITSESDPTVPSSVKDGITWTEISSRPSGLDDGDDVGITSESDPTVTSSVKNGVDWNEILNPIVLYDVGMGTSDPQGLFHVSAGTSGDAILILEADTDNNNESDQPSIQFWQDGRLAKSLVGYDNRKNGLQLQAIAPDGGAYISFSVGDETITEMMRLTSEGRLGIGTPNPLEKVHIMERSDIYGASILLDSTNFTGGRKFYVGSTLSGNAGGAGLFQIYDGTSRVPRFNIDFEGDVGIGTTNPEAKLHVVTYSRDGIHSESSAEWRSGVYGVSSHTDGYGLFGRNSNNNTRGYIGGAYGIWAKAETGVYAAYFEGRARCDILEIAGADLSEQYNIQSVESGIAPSPGMVVSIDPKTPGDLIVSHRAYDRKVAGIISGAGDIDMGLVMGKEDTTDETKKPVALTGRVYCQADTSNGPIEPGDLLTTSETPGHAMKVSDYAKAQGAILGKAMSSLEKGKGLVLVLVSLQ